MKLSKISLAVVFGASLSAVAMANGGPQNRTAAPARPVAPRVTVQRPAPVVNITRNTFRAAPARVAPPSFSVPRVVRPAIVASQPRVQAPARIVQQTAPTRIDQVRPALPAQRETVPTRIDQTRALPAQHLTVPTRIDQTHNALPAQHETVRTETRQTTPDVKVQDRTATVTKINRQTVRTEPAQKVVFNHVGTTTYRNVHPVIGNSYNVAANNRLHDAYVAESRDHRVQVEHFDHHRGDWRYGYDQRRDFDASRFYFGLYLFSPFEEACVASPWYYYDNLPAYLPTNAVVIDNDYCSWNLGVHYTYNPNLAFYSYGNPGLNQTIDYIRSLFQNGDVNVIGDLIPDSGQVGIYDGSRAYEYSLSGADFQQMLADNAANTQTISYQVTSVTQEGGTVVVIARHTFQTADQGTQTVYQEYRLSNEGGRYVIADFMTSDVQPSW